MLIVQIEGNVKHPITLDPTVWIFDDRKILLEEAFKLKQDGAENDSAQDDMPWNRDQYQQQLNPPINNSINKLEGKKALENSYLMPINYFLPNSKPNENAMKAILHTDNGEKEITIEQLNQSLLLFALDGKPLKEDGPVHLYFGDGSNQNTPFKGINRIEIM
ncbi:hypothetical protein [Tenuibacillus multivorans]|uniref:Peptidyl-prolyl cis-trans isomerase n=1 Tax=Tenuibacillus multivorans TaxID=237069 RepID=A0A1G9YAJ0_9BACI|nr:hypothetical protein [Tenuibacillus multivorans]GEL76018.1 hypothetical protein TMU01_02530 [Tenuibacillus multivorans]SDN06144.1 hypothetical protein SAMN05216498_1314 [Tenuibacillus multivorans]